MSNICCIYTEIVPRIEISHLQRKLILSARRPQLGPGLIINGDFSSELKAGAVVQR